MSLSGQVALVTGGGTGIGKAIAQAMHKEGAKIIIVGRKAGFSNSDLNFISSIHFSVLTCL